MANRNTTTKNQPAHDTETGELLPIPEWAAGLPVASNAEDAVTAMVGRILDAESIEALLEEQKAAGLGDYVDVPIVVHDVRISPSTQKDGAGFFATLDIEVAKTGQHVVVTTGAVKVLAQIAKAHKMGWLPLPCKLIERVSKSDPSRKVQQLVTPDAF